MFAQNKSNDSINLLFNKFDEQNWEEVFFDSCTNDWQQNWILDGEKANISHTKKGMDFFAGKNRKEDAAHAVLWTKESFKGDVKITYDYTKIDDVIEAVTILYIQATGSGKNEFDEDILQWANKRKIPAMKMYFNHMNTYHISYAAFKVGNKNKKNDYIRARRYNPENGNLANTKLSPNYSKTGLFKKNVLHKITVIKKKKHLFMKISNDEQTYLCHWYINKLTPIDMGRIGLRHMWTRGSRYKNFSVSKCINK